MLSLSPTSVRRVIHHYEPWGLVQESWHRRFAGSGNSGEKGSPDESLLVAIGEYGVRLKDESDDALRSRYANLRSRVEGGIPLDSVLVETFALVREASLRVLGLFHYDVQILGGLAICRGTIAEMATGEGKTLVQSLAAVARSLTGQGVHVATSNGYLAERDFEFAKPLFTFLGVTAELLPERVSASQKRPAYLADVTYGTGTEFGFDYLRDQVSLMQKPTNKIGTDFRNSVAGRKATAQVPLAQRGLAFAIIDEIDSVLIDDASTPLVISGKSGDTNPGAELYLTARELVDSLDPDKDIILGPNPKEVRFSDSGEEKCAIAGETIPWELAIRPWEIYTGNALKAAYLFERDRDYVVNAEDSEIVLVDPFTGRVREGSAWKEGLHQAVEVKEQLPPSAESASVAGISRQRFYRLYEGLGGMTGTASEAAGEFWKFYELSVTPVPRNKPSQAKRLPNRIFTTDLAKREAIAADLIARRGVGQPVLIGCHTIAASETLSQTLTQRGIPHTLLNAKTSDEEAAIIAAAGELGAVTIATNMAGRGTHISLSDDLLKIGGLHVIATGLDVSSRIDRQLTGRAARQGEPGSHQFFLSGEDTLLEELSPKIAKQLSEKARSDANGEVSASKWFSHFETAQRECEKARYQSRVAGFLQNELINESKQLLY